MDLAWNEVAAETTGAAAAAAVVVDTSTDDDFDENEDGRVSYKELLDFMLDILMHIEREAYVQEVAFENEMMKYGYMYGYEGEFDEARTDEPPPAEPIDPAYEAAQEGTFDATMI